MAELDNSFSEVISGAIATGVTDGLRRCGLILIDEQEPERLVYNVSENDSNRPTFK